MRSAKSYINLLIHAGWSESLMGALWIAKDPMILQDDRTDGEGVGVFYYLMQNMEKRPFCHVQTANVLKSEHTRADWSENSLFVDIYYSINSFCKPTRKTQISLHEYT